MALSFDFLPVPVPVLVPGAARLRADAGVVVLAGVGGVVLKRHHISSAGTPCSSSSGVWRIEREKRRTHITTSTIRTPHGTAQRAVFVLELLLRNAHELAGAVGGGQAGDGFEFVVVDLWLIWSG